MAILFYHRVEEVAQYPWCLPATRTRDFEDQIRYICQKHEVVPLDKLAQCLQESKPLPKKAVVITFDDGYKDIYLNVYPVLKRYSVPATIFVATGPIDSGELFWFDKVRYAIYNTALEALELEGVGKCLLRSTNERLQGIYKVFEKLRELPEKGKNSLVERLINVSGVNIPHNLGKEIMLSWDEAREMADNGITFGAHTITYRVLTRLPLDEARKEIIESKRRIEEELGRPVTSFAYPRGGRADFNEEIKEILKEAGFTCAVTSVYQLVSHGADLYELGRIGAGHNLDILSLSLSGLNQDLGFILKQVRRGS